MAKGGDPHQVADHFFKALMHNQCHVCFELFSHKTQKEFLQWTLNDMYHRHPDAARAASIGGAEVKLLFEKNDTTVMKTFWKRFFFSSNANDFFQFGYYETVQQKGSQATVRVEFRYPDGRTAQVELTMIKEKGAWKLGYIESGLPF